MQENNIIIDWLRRRKITDNIIQDFDIHVGNHFSLGECIVIPIKNKDGIFIFNKYRRNPLSEVGSKYVYDQGGVVTLFGADKIQDSPTVLICEGEMDALVAWSHNIPAISSTGGAQSFQKEWAETLVGKDVIICFDNDEAGGSGMAKAIDILPQAKILFLPDRPGIKDISDYVQNGGDLHTLIQSAVSFTSMESIMQHRTERIALWQSTYFHDAYIKNHTPKHIVHRPKAPMGEDMLERAKSFPIENLIVFNKNKSKCLWHNEKTQSLQKYLDNNRCYCFGCGKFADAIDVYRAIHECSFLEAVKKLQ